MSNEHFAQQVEAFTEWKNNISTEVSCYSHWLERNRLGNASIEATLKRAITSLKTNEVTLAFVGEMSRGKTELINSLFFSQYSQRLLPSYVGHTTQCPTEIFFDPLNHASTIRLLPIGTRLGSVSISDLKNDPNQWSSIALNINDTTSMANAFKQVAQTKLVKPEEAQGLGFDVNYLDRDPQSELVHIPAWRHALINFDHPLLRKGLRVLDTPGLNAIGSEPEVTLSMLPNADVILFMLGVDTGVTASDLEIWQQHLAQSGKRMSGSRFAVLNKIDILWDDIAGPEFVEKAIADIRAFTAKQLQIRVDDVLPLSAKQAMLARSRKDPVLLERSQIEKLETLLGYTILHQKERLLGGRVTAQLQALLQASQKIMQARAEKIRSQRDMLGAAIGDQDLYVLNTQTREEHSYHHKRLLSLRSSQKLIDKQTEMLLNAVKFEHLQGYLKTVREGLLTSLTTMGINRAIVRFFKAIEQDQFNLDYELRLTNQLIDSIYRRHNEEESISKLVPNRLDLRRFTHELETLKAKAEHFRKNPKHYLMQQRLLVRRFFNTLADRVIHLYKRMHVEINRWEMEALMPMAQNVLEQKHQLESHMIMLTNMVQQKQSGDQQRQRLDASIQEIEQQLEEATAMYNVFSRPLQRNRRQVPVTY